MYRRILLAYDGSLEGALALREGALLAKACCCEVVLLSVAPGTPGVQMAEAVQGGVIAQLLDSQRQLLDRACARLTQLGFAPIARLECGEPAQIIGVVAAEMGADLVVVGHHEQSMLSRWWSGSTDASLIDHVDCSVLVCRNPISDEAFEAAARANAEA